jgi:D-alanyl-D-alanine carboxypeptidase
MANVTHIGVERRKRRRDAQRKREILSVLLLTGVLALLLLAGWYAAPSLLLFGRGDEVAAPIKSELSLNDTVDSLTKLTEKMSVSEASSTRTSEIAVSHEVDSPLVDEQPLPSQIERDDWRLLLVNPWNYIPEGYDITLTQLMNGHSVDERCYPDLQEMMDACRADGNSPLICSSYRSQQKQEQLFENRVTSLIAQGYSEADARTEAATINAIPGTSEHQLGLAVDIVDVNNQNLDESQESAAVQKWLMQNSWKYGFILRYPSGKSDVTGIIYESWHYRYVGKDAAKEMFEQGLCLEEYLQLL